MKVVITAATEMEISKLRGMLSNRRFADIGLKFHVSGIGMMLSCYSIQKMLVDEQPDLVVQVGIGGSFVSDLELGQVVVVEKDCMGDVGVTETMLTGGYKDLFDMELMGRDEAPFRDGMLVNSYAATYAPDGLKRVTGTTINKVSTDAHWIRELQAKYGCEVETMEGAALHYCCLQVGVPFVQLRAISNYVGERDKSKWEFRKSVENVTECAVKLLEQLSINQ